MSNIYVGYSPNDFFYQDTKGLKQANDNAADYLPDLTLSHDTVTLANNEGRTYTINNGNVALGNRIVTAGNVVVEPGNLLIKDLTKTDCTSYFGDHKLACIKNQIYINKENVDVLTSMDISHDSAYAKNSGNAEEFQDVFLNTVNLSIGILFIMFVIFKIQNIKK